MIWTPFFSPNLLYLTNLFWTLKIIPIQLLKKKNSSLIQLWASINHQVSCNISSISLKLQQHSSKFFSPNILPTGPAPHLPPYHSSLPNLFQNSHQIFAISSSLILPISSTQLLSLSDVFHLWFILIPHLSPGSSLLTTTRSLPPLQSPSVLTKLLISHQTPHLPPKSSPPTKPLTSHQTPHLSPNPLPAQPHLDLAVCERGVINLPPERGDLHVWQPDGLICVLHLLLQLQKSLRQRRMVLRSCKRWTL